MNNHVIRDLLSRIDEKNILPNESLSKHTFTKTGGKGDIVITPESYEDVRFVYQYALKNHIPVTILGNGSNLIIKDGGIRGFVVILTKLKNITLNDNQIIAQTGAAIIDTSRFALKHCLTGLEFACGIPGSVGGALYMNAGAYGGEISQVLKSALALDNTGEFVVLKKEELELGYRKSNIEEKGVIILEATFELKPAAYDAIKAVMDDLTYKRESKQPLEYPSCGSVFKRPPGYFAGKLIQDCGLQGKQIGGAQVSTKHAGFIVNLGAATASDYLALIKHIQNTVKRKFGVELETEVRIIGEDAPS